MTIVTIMVKCALTNSSTKCCNSNRNTNEHHRFNRHSNRPIGSLLLSHHWYFVKCQCISCFPRDHAIPPKPTQYKLKSDTKTHSLVPHHEHCKIFTCAHRQKDTILCKFVELFGRLEIDRRL